MARVALEIPKVGLVMENARLVRWLKNVGDLVQQGEALLEVETEKSVVEIEATESGRLVEILLEVDAEASVGDQIAWLETDTPEPAKPLSADLSVSAGNVIAPAGAGEPPAQEPARVAPRQSAAASGSRLESPTTSRVRSSPAARRLATDHYVDLRQVTGSGPNGRIQLSDVAQAIDSRDSGAAPPQTDPSRGTALTSMRRALARSVCLSNATIPQFAVERAVDWTSVRGARAQLQAQSAAPVPVPSVNDFLLLGIARALTAFPALNATFEGDPASPAARIVPAAGAHIGLVVAVAEGLLIPVFHHVEQLSLTALARQRQDVVTRALSGKLKRDELEGATFSVSNLGARGPDRFNAIISPPQSAILAVGRQRDSVVVIAGTMQIKPMSQLTLSVDHRIADGRLAADFLAHLVQILESGDWRTD